MTQTKKLRPVDNSVDGKAGAGLILNGADDYPAESLNLYGRRGVKRPEKQAKAHFYGLVAKCDFMGFVALSASQGVD